jgi:spermidine/putrescine transport system substrate-binding protein
MKEKKDSMNKAERFSINNYDLNRRQFIKGTAGFLLTSAGLWSCLPQKTFAADEEPVLNAFVLSGYEEPEMLTKFERDTGIKVNLKIGNGHEEMFAMIKSSPKGTWDVSTVTSAYIQQCAEAGYLMPIDESRLPLDRFMKPFDKWPLNYYNGKMYALINRYGYYGLTYNTNHLTRDECSSYDILFDPKLKGKVALFDWFLPIMGVIGRYLGYKDPYVISEDQLEAIRAKLFELRPQVGLIGNNAQTIQALASQSYWVTIAGEWVQAGLADEGLPYGAILPKEGGVTWDQSAVILKNAPHPNNAMKFIEYLAGAHFQAKLAVAKVYYSMVPNINAVDMLSKEHRKLLNLEDPTKFQTEYLNNLAPRKFPENVDAWKNIWAEFKSM